MTDAEYAAGAAESWPARGTDRGGDRRSVGGELSSRCSRREGWNVRKADNDVLAGIRQDGGCAASSGKIVICDTLHGLPAGDGAVCLGREGGT